MADGLEQLLRNNRLIWRGRGAVKTTSPGRTTGYAALDGLLPEGGWPADALVELLVPQWGVGELQLLRPAMAAATAEGRWLVCIAPPHIPYAPALQSWGIDLRRLLVVQPSEREVAWVMEQALRQPRCAMVLAWPGLLKPVAVRRLQLAAEAGRSLGILLRQQQQAPLPVALRLSLTPHSAVTPPPSWSTQRTGIKGPGGGDIKPFNTFDIDHHPLTPSWEEGERKCDPFHHRVNKGVKVTVLKSRATCRRQSITLDLQP